MTESTHGGARGVEELEAELDLLRTAVIGAEVAAPATHERVLEMIVETAASVISARAGALFLVDEEPGRPRLPGRVRRQRRGRQAVPGPARARHRGRRRAQRDAARGLEREQRPALGEGHRLERRLRARQHRLRAALLRGPRDRRARAARQGGGALVHARATCTRSACSRTRRPSRSSSRGTRARHAARGSVGPVARARLGTDRRDPSLAPRSSSRELVREVAQAGEQRARRPAATSCAPSPSTLRSRPS